MKIEKNCLEENNTYDLKENVETLVHQIEVAISELRNAYFI